MGLWPRETFLDVDSPSMKNRRMKPSFRKIWLSGVVPLTLGIAILALGLSTYWFFSTPTRFTIAVASQDEAEAKMVGAFARALKELKKDVQLEIVTFNTISESAHALQEKKVDLALVRPDVFLPNNGLTVAILREDAVIIVAPSDDVAELEGKRIGVVAAHESDIALVRSILAFYDLKSPGITLIPMAASSVAASFESKTIDALAVVGPIGQTTAGVVSAALKAAGRKMTIVPLEQSAAMSLETPILQDVTISEGSFGGQPRQPEEDIKTTGVSYRLMARATADRSAVSRLTEYLFQLRSRIAKSVPAINLMKAPDETSVMSAALPNHPGAVDYLTREQETFMDRYGDWIWLGLFFGGGASSAAAWTFRLFARRRRERVDEVLDRLLTILNEARATEDPARLDGLSCEIDTLVIRAVRQAHSGATDTRTMSALILAIDAARAAVAEQRRRLAADHDPSGRGLRAVHSLGDGH